jgi:hypothetical protein
MVAVIFEFLFFILLELVFYTMFYLTGAFLIRLLTLWKVRYPYLGRKVFKERKDQIDHLWLCISIGMIFYLIVGVGFYLQFFENQ